MTTASGVNPNMSSASLKSFKVKVKKKKSNSQPQTENVHYLVIYLIILDFYV